MVGGQACDRTDAQLAAQSLAISSMAKSVSPCSAVAGKAGGADRGT